MLINIYDDVANNQRLVIIKIPNAYLSEKCQPHPAANLITLSQGMGIIEDGVLLAMGLELKKR